MSDRALVIETVQALHERGWSVGKSLRFVSERAPESDVKTRLVRLAHALEEGLDIDPAKDDPLLVVLSRGERVSADALSDAAAAMELETRARAVMTRALAAGVTVAFISVVIAWIIPHVYDVSLYGDTSGIQLPGLTTFVLKVVVPLTLVAPVGVFVIGATALISLAAGRFPGISGLTHASRLRFFAAAVESGYSENDAAQFVGKGRDLLSVAPLDPNERLYAQHLMTIEGPAEAARAVALEKEISATRAWLWLSRVVPVAAMLFLGFTIGTIVLSFYLPIFTLWLF